MSSASVTSRCKAVTRALTESAFSERRDESDAFQALYELRRLQRVVSSELKGFVALVVPTIPTIFTIEEMLAEPMKRNTIMGTYTCFVNPLDLCAVSVPGVGRDDGLPSALCFVGAAGEDGALRTIAHRFEGRPTP